LSTPETLPKVVLDKRVFLMSKPSSLEVILY